MQFGLKEVLRADFVKIRFVGFFLIGASIYVKIGIFGEESVCSS
jgi:hypothetical protein